MSHCQHAREISRNAGIDFTAQKSSFDISPLYSLAGTHNEEIVSAHHAEILRRRKKDQTPTTIAAWLTKKDFMGTGATLNTLLRFDREYQATFGPRSPVAGTVKIAPLSKEPITNADRGGIIT